MFKIRLKELRENKGMNQREFAADFGVSAGTIGMWESGAREPKTLEDLQRIADYFGVSVDYLLGREDNKIAPAPKSERQSSDDTFVRIRRTREQRGIKQKDFALSIGIAANTLSQYETGKRQPDPETLKLIASGLDVTVDELLGAAVKKAPAPVAGDGLDEKDIRLVNWFRSLPPDEKKAILTLGEAPADLDK